MIEAFEETRRFTEKICSPLETEDYVIQSIPDVSPPKWHLAHTTWFFENFILSRFSKDYQWYRPEYRYLFNSYYKSVGEHALRCRRGILSRPTVREIYEYRQSIHSRLVELLKSASPDELALIHPILTLGIHHEQQHQELLLTDIKHIYWSNSLRPTYSQTLEQTSEQDLPPSNKKVRTHKISFKEGMQEIGQDGTGFSFDNEKPKHKVYLEPFELSSRLVTNREYLAFMEAGGYENPAFWLSDGWNCVEKYRWSSPLYWEKQNNQWWVMTLSGTKPLSLDEPVCHVSYYEADAFCKWNQRRLPTEAEWEVAAQQTEAYETQAFGAFQGNFVESNHLHPKPISEHTTTVQSSDSFSYAHQLFGDVWEWTSTPYQPYPGFTPLPGAVGEYNGKFMCNQIILRGGSCLTPRSHIRRTYRNFFAPETRWQMSGFRLAGAPSLHEPT